MQALARALAAGAFPHLRELHLRNNQLGDAGIRELLQDPVVSVLCKELEVLNLMGNGISDEGGEAIRQVYALR